MTLLATIIIANASPSSALAAVEEAAGSSDSVSDYNQSSFSFDLINYSTQDVLLGAAINLSGDVSIPTTVWSLDASTVHLQDIPSEVGTDLGGAFRNSREFAHFWTQVIGGSWTNSYEAFRARPFSSLRLQAASCGGNSAERSNLEFCDINTDYSKEVSDLSDLSTQDSASGNVIAPDNSVAMAIGSNSPSASSQEPQPVVGPDLSSPTPAEHFFGRHRHHLVSTAPTDNPITSVDDPTPPIDGPIAPVDDPIAVGDPIAPIVYGDPPSVYPEAPIGDPGPISDPPPFFVPPPQSPIPETSTWIMMTLGFGMMSIMMHIKRRNSIKNRLSKAFHRFS